MTEDDLKRLKELPVPAPREGAKEAAIAAALVAFKRSVSPDVGAPQGSAVLPRLRDTSPISEGSSKMRFRRPAAIAASIVALAVAVPLFMTHLVRTPTAPDGVAPRDKLAALPDPIPAYPPAPPPPTDMERTGGAASTRPAPSVGTAPEEKSTACPSETLCMRLTGQIEQIKQKAAEVLAKRKAPTAAENAPAARGVPRPPATSGDRIATSSPLPGEKGEACQAGRTCTPLPDEDARSLIFDDKLLFDIDKFAGYDRFVTFRPSYYADRGVLWGGEFRQRLETGRYSIDIAALDDELNPNAVVDSPLGNWRGSLQAKGQFNLDSWWKYGWDITLENGNGRAPYDISADQRIPDVPPFKFQENECFVLTASYIETFVENAALDLRSDRTLMLRYELKSLCQYGYGTDALNNFFYGIHRENAPTSGAHVAASGAIPAKKPDGLFGPAPKIGRAQPVYLQTDRLVYDDKNSRVIAEGNVEIYYNNFILTADKVIYDKGSNALTAEGNAQLKDPNGSVTRADRFEAADDFRDAFVQSLSVVTQDNARIAALSAIRKEGNVPPTVAQEARRIAALPQAKAPSLVTTPAADFHRRGSPAPHVGAQDFAPAAAAPAPTQAFISIEPATSSSSPGTARPAPAERVQACPPGRTCVLLQPKQVKEKAGQVQEKASAKVAVLEAGERSRLSLEAPQPAQDGRDRFAVVAVNPVKSVASEPVSTFSIDVDSASYSFVRRALNSAQLPPREAVRVEEMINYFPYDYPLPEDRSAPFRPTVSVLPSPWNPTNKLVHIAIKGYDVPKAERPRANLVLLIDTSGSMAPEDRLPLLKNAFRMLIDTLRPDDTVGVVTYAGQTHAALEPTKVADKRKILEAIERLNAGGSTAGGAGIQEAYRMAEGAFDKTAVNRVILATDGDFNVGITDVGQLKSFIERKRETGIYLSVLGVGRGNYNDALMQALAQNGNGVAAYIDTLNEARKVLVDESSSTLFPIAKDVKIQIEFNPATVAEYRLIGYETRLLRREDFNNDKVDAGDIGSGHTVTAIYEVTPVGSPRFVEDLRYKLPTAATPSDGKGEYGFLRVNYKLPAETVSRRIELPITPALEKAAMEQASTEVRFSIAVAAFGQLLRGDPYLKGFGYDEVIALAASARGEDLFGYRAEFLNLVRLAKTAHP